MKFLQYLAQTIDVAPLPQGINADQSFVQNSLNIVFTITGAIAVLVIVIAGIKYAGSQGDPQGISKAKATIIYALVGLLVIILASVIVNFVITRVAP